MRTTLVKNPDGTYTATHPDQTVWTFAISGLLTRSTDRHGNVSALTYNAGRLTSVSDWLSPARVVQFGYDASGRLQSVTDREGKTTTYGYDGTSVRLTTITDANGHVAVTNHYDAQGRVDWQKDAGGSRPGSRRPSPTSSTATTRRRRPSPTP